MKKVVLKLDLPCDKYRKKAMKTASGLSGVESVSLDPKDQKLTVTGDIDPVCIVKKLRKVCCTEIISVGPAKEPEKKKEEPKKVEAKKEEAKKQEVVVHPNPSMCHYPPLQPCYCFRWAEQDPNPCIICSFFS